MKRAFVNNVDTFSGNAIVTDLSATYDLCGTLQGGLNGCIPWGVKQVLSRAVPSELLKSVLNCHVIVYDLHNADFEELEFIAQGKSNERKYVIISSQA